MILSEKVALVTGATGGLGTAIVLALSNKDVKVHVTGRNKTKLNKFYDNHNIPRVIQADLRDTHELKKLIDTVKPDILVNCAGLFPVKSITDTSEEDFDETFDINVRAPFILTKLAAEYMKQNEWGRIINIASSSAYAGFSNTSVYCASKHALLGFSRSAYHELKNDGIRVYCFSPGSIKTEMGRLVEGQDYDTFMEPDEIASFIVEAISYDGNMISEEIRLNRMVVQ